MEKLHYEALGRYTIATERLQEYLQTRSSALFDLKRSLEPVVNIGNAARSVTGFDFEAAYQLLNKAQEADAAAHRMVDEANAVAAQCAKPQIAWRQ